MKTKRSRRWKLGLLLLFGVLFAVDVIESAEESLSSRAARALPVTDVEGANEAMVGIELPDWATPKEAITAAGTAAFFVSADGLAVTSYHALGGARRFEVNLAADPSKRFDAEVLGASQCDDLALIRVDVEDVVPYLRWHHGPVASELAVTSLGYIASEDEFTRQVGAAGAGSLGGPQVTADGAVVGVNATGVAPGEGNATAAIPAALAEWVIGGFRAGRPELGIDVEPIDPSLGLRGVVVTGLMDDSRGAWADLGPGDVIVSIDGEAVGTDGTLRGYCDAIRRVGDEPVEIDVFRSYRNEHLRLQLNGPRPVDVLELMQQPMGL